MARFCSLIAIAGIAYGCHPEAGDNFCRKIQSSADIQGRNVLYLHVIGPDFIMAYDPACKKFRLEDIDFSRSEKKGEIFYIIRRSEEGYSVPYNVDIVRDGDKNQNKVYLISKNQYFKDIKFHYDVPPPPPRQN